MIIIITMSTTTAPAAPNVIFTVVVKPFWGAGAFGLTGAGKGFTLVDVGGGPPLLSKLQLNVTLDIVTFAALTSRPGLQIFNGAHGGVGLNV